MTTQNIISCQCKHKDLHREAMERLRGIKKKYERVEEFEKRSVKKMPLDIKEKYTCLYVGAF